jgi:DNA-binding response OmpR family regulator
MKIYLVDDDTVLLTFIKESLKHYNFLVDSEQDGKKALNFLKNNWEDYSAVILDIGLPVMDGLEVCQKLREAGAKLPILILSEKHSTEVKVEILNAGADDYLTKPFEINELVARLNAHLRRYSEGTEATTKVHDVEIDPSSMVIRVKGQEVYFTHTEYRLLRLLISKKGEVVTRSTILNKVWDTNATIFSNSIDVHIRKIREKLSKSGSILKIDTVRGVGYRIK